MTFRRWMRVSSCSPCAGMVASPDQLPTTHRGRVHCSLPRAAASNKQLHAQEKLMDYTFLANLQTEFALPEKGILSRVLHKDEHANITDRKRGAQVKKLY